MKLSVIIVNYNVTRLLDACLKSLVKFVQGVQYEIIVIDNCSLDQSWQELIAKYPQVKFIASESNDGFAVANNRGVQNASGEYVLLLNPDTELEGFYMKEVLDFADNISNFGCLGIGMHDANGNFLPESKRSVPNMFNSFEKLFTGFKKNNSKSYYRNDLKEDGVAEVEILTGAFLLVKKSVYEEVGGLDERYFMYGEDIDLCYSILQKKYSNWYYGKASILHHKGESTVKDKVYLQRFYGAMEIFIDKYYRTKNPIQYYLLLTGLKIRHWLERIKLQKERRFK